jgi:hypothetical protein
MDSGEREFRRIPEMHGPDRQTPGITSPSRAALLVRLPRKETALGVHWTSRADRWDGTVEKVKTCVGILNSGNPLAPSTSVIGSFAEVRLHRLFSKREV